MAIICDRELEHIGLRQDAGIYAAGDSETLLAEVKRLRRWEVAGVLLAHAGSDSGRLAEVAHRVDVLLEEDQADVGCPCPWCLEDDPQG